MIISQNPKTAQMSKNQDIHGSILLQADASEWSRALKFMGHPAYSQHQIHTFSNVFPT